MRIKINIPANSGDVDFYFNTQALSFSTHLHAYAFLRHLASEVIREHTSTGWLHLSVVTSTVTQPGPLSLIWPGEQAPRSTLNVEPGPQPGYVPPVTAWQHWNASLYEYPVEHPA